MLIQINKNIAVTAQDLIIIQNSYLQIEAWEKMSIFVADMRSNVNIANKNKDVSILGQGPIQGLDETILKAEATYPVNLTQPKKSILCL